MRTWSAALQFDKIQRVPADKWPKRWLTTSTPGMLLMQPGSVGVVGGLLCVSRDGMFITLTPEQVFSEALIPWAGVNPDFLGIILRGTRVELVSK